MNTLILFIGMLCVNVNSIAYSYCKQERLFLDQFANAVHARSSEIRQPVHGFFRFRSDNIYRYFDVNRQKNVVVIFAEFELCETCFCPTDYYLLVPNEEAKGKCVVWEGECASVIVNPLVSDQDINIRVEHAYYSTEDLKEFEQNLRELTKSRFGW